MLKSVSFRNLQGTAANYPLLRQEKSLVLLYSRLDKQDESWKAVNAKLFLILFFLKELF